MRLIMFFVILKIFLTILFILIAPLLLICALPIYLFRFILTKIAPWAQPDFGKILNSRSSIYGSDNIYEGSPISTIAIITHCVLEGQFDLEQFRQMFFTRVIQLKDSENGELQNPELQQSVKQWSGFLFWKWDRQFNIKHHIRMYEPNKNDFKKDGYNVHDLAMIGESLLRQPFAMNKSPWEILLFNNISIDENKPNREEGQSYCGFILHVHHSLLDGFSMLKLLMLDLGHNVELNVAQPSKPQPMIFAKLKKWILAPYDFVSAGLDQADQLNQFHLPLSKLSLDAHAGVSMEFSLKKLKEIKNALHVQSSNFTPTLYGLIVTVYAEGLRKYLLEQNFKLPGQISIVFLLAKSNHPPKLRNHFTGCSIRIPSFNKSMSINKRLELIELEMLKQKESVVPEAVFLSMNLFGSLPVWMTKIFNSVNQSSAAVSNLPGPPTMVNIADMPLIHFWPTVRMPGNIGLGVVASTYNGKMRLAVRIDKSIVCGVAGELSASKLISNILEEFNNFNSSELIV